MSRRRGSATALNASEVVEARATGEEYMPIWAYVKCNFACQHDACLVRNELLHAQCFDGIDRRGTSGGDVTGEQRGDGKDGGHTRERGQIPGANAEEQAAH